MLMFFQKYLLSQSFLIKSPSDGQYEYKPVQTNLQGKATSMSSVL